MSKKISDVYYFDETFKMHYYFTKTEKRFNKVVASFGVSNDVKNVNGNCLILDDNGQCIILIYAREGRSEIIAHEAAHAAIYLMNLIGQPIHDDEVLPYIIESIVRNFNFKAR